MKSKSSKNGKPRQLAKEVIIDVTEEDYRRMQAKGIHEDALLKPGRHRFVRGLNPLIRAGLLPATSPKKARVSILLDEDIIEHFKQRAASPNALPFQTQINNTLRAAVVDDLGGVTVEVEDESAALLNNQTFIQAVACSVKEQLAQERKRRKRA